jgi:UDP-N-acetylglucosamine:LPS N-acetylglucosamine transferase
MIIEIVKLDEINSFYAQSAKMYNHMAQNDPALYENWYQILQEQQDNPFAQNERFLKQIAQRVIDLHQPQIVIAVAIASAQLAAAFQQCGKIFHATLVTDWFGKCPRGWFHKNTDLLYSPSQRNADYLIETEGATVEKMVIGNPVIHLQEKIDQVSKSEMKKQLGLKPDRDIFLVNTYGNKKMIQWFENKRFASKIQFVLLCYGNEELYKEAKNLPAAKSGNLVPILWTKEMAKYLYVSEVIFSKPGPGLLIESLHMNCVVFLNGCDHIMSQEQEVRDFILKNKLGVLIENVEDWKKYTQMYMKKNSWMEKLRKNVARFEVSNGLSQFCSLVVKQGLLS